MALYYQTDPTLLCEEQVNDYLLYLQESLQPSESYFKHTIYGLRYALRLKGEEMKIRLPVIHRDKQLPSVLNYRELKQLIQTPKLLKHKILLALIYDGSLRIKKVSNLRIKDIDLERCTLQVRQSKYNKDRIVPISKMIVRGLQTYYSVKRPIEWVFNGRIKSYKAQPLSVRGIQAVVRETVKKCGFEKKVTCHTLRHSYATHLLEMGLDLVSIKEQLGHSSIQTTMIYLRVAQLDRERGFSPLDKLYDHE